MFQSKRIKTVSTLAIVLSGLALSLGGIPAFADDPVPDAPTSASGDQPGSGDAVSPAILAQEKALQRQDKKLRKELEGLERKEAPIQAKLKLVDEKTKALQPKPKDSFGEIVRIDDQFKKNLARHGKSWKDVYYGEDKDGEICHMNSSSADQECKDRGKRLATAKTSTPTSIRPPKGDAGNEWFWSAGHEWFWSDDGVPYSTEYACTFDGNNGNLCHSTEYACAFDGYDGYDGICQRRGLSLQHRIATAKTSTPTSIRPPKGDAGNEWFWSDDGFPYSTEYACVFDGNNGNLCQRRPWPSP